MSLTLEATKADFLGRKEKLLSLLQSDDIDLVRQTLIDTHYGTREPVYRIRIDEHAELADLLEELLDPITDLCVQYGLLLQRNSQVDTQFEFQRFPELLRNRIKRLRAT